MSSSKQKHKAPKTKRLDGKPKLIVFTAQMTADIRSYCRDRGIESESEFVRQAVSYYITREYDEETLKLFELKKQKENISQIMDMLSVFFSYINFMHQNLLAYHPEIDDQIKESAMASAKVRIDKFFESFRSRLHDDPPLFEKLLHKYVAGTLNE